MNGRKAKALRRVAERATVGAHYAAYEVEGRTPRSDGTIRLVAGTTKHLYRFLKREARERRRGC